VNILGLWDQAIKLIDQLNPFTEELSDQEKKELDEIWKQELNDSLGFDKRDIAPVDTVAVRAPETGQANNLNNVLSQPKVQAVIETSTNGPKPPTESELNQYWGYQDQELFTAEVIIGEEKMVNAIALPIIKDSFGKMGDALESKLSTMFQPNPLFVNPYLNDPNALDGGYQWTYDEFAVPWRAKVGPDGPQVHPEDLKAYVKRQKFTEDNAQTALAKGKPFSIMGATGSISSRQSISKGPIKAKVIESTQVIKDHSSIPSKSTPNSVVDYIGKDGKVNARV
jgi:hypothetical protein